MLYFTFINTRLKPLLIFHFSCSQSVSVKHVCCSLLQSFAYSKKKKIHSWDYWWAVQFIQCLVEVWDEKHRKTDKFTSRKTRRKGYRIIRLEWLKNKSPVSPPQSVYMIITCMGLISPPRSPLLWVPNCCGDPSSFPPSPRESQGRPLWHPQAHPTWSSQNSGRPADTWWDGAGLTQDPRKQQSGCWEAGPAPHSLPKTPSQASPL